MSAVNTGAGYDFSQPGGLFSAAIFGGSTAPASTFTGGDEGFWGSVQNGIESLGSLSGLALNTYGQYRNIRAGTQVAQQAPETTPDQRYVADIQGPRGSASAVPAGWILAGVAVLAVVAVIVLRK
ncbi:MAG: hypothetical protein Q8Q73_14770 [Stagnimonas sp.]|nr:hypothetical protein [Stagnimonas sp.]